MKFAILTAVSILICVSSSTPFSLAYTPSKDAPSLAKQLLEHIKILTSDKYQGRLSGDRGELLTRTYIAQFWKNAGLKSGAPDYLQCFDMTTSTTPSPDSTARFFDAEGKYDLKLDEHFTPITLSSSGEIKAPVVFAGYGITSQEFNYDDYNGLDVQGKIVLLLEHEPQETDPHSIWDGTSLTYYSDVGYKITHAREVGARGAIILLDGPRHPEWTTHWSTWHQSYGAHDSGIPVVYLDYKKFSMMFPEYTEAIRSWIETTDREGHKPPPQPKDLKAYMKIRLERKKTRACNIIAIIPGKDPKSADHAILLGAHYDHLGHGEIGRRDSQHVGSIHPGADDNASGTALIMELGRILQEQDELGHTIVLVAFTGEERGLLGSRAYVENPAWPLEKTMAMINFDMVGRLRDRLILFGTETAPKWDPIVKQISFPLPISTLGEGYGPSDHTSFFLKGIPVLHIFTGSHEDHHQPSDTVEKINAEGLAEIALWSLRILRALDTETNLGFQASTRRHGNPQMASSPGMKVTLGTIPDYAFDGDGVRLMGVREDSPAAKAKLQREDIILKLGDYDIHNIYDLTYALSHLEADVPVSLLILRNGQKMYLEITPKGRK